MWQRQLPIGLLAGGRLARKANEKYLRPCTNAQSQARCEKRAHQRKERIIMLLKKANALIKYETVKSTIALL